MRLESRWLNLVEHRAYARLRQLRTRQLWDGAAPVPVEFVIEHLLDLRISWESVDEEPDECILACLRPLEREVVLNERHRGRFADNPGEERFSLAHEAGHADVFALTGEADQLSLIATSAYRPQRRSATRGPVVALPRRLRELSRETRTEVLRALKDRERSRWAEGEDTPIQRRTVDHYAAVLLMPADLVQSATAGCDLASWREISGLARRFGVSVTAMRIRLEELGLIFRVEDNRILLTDPAQRDQGSLF